MDRNIENILSDLRDTADMIEKYYAGFGHMKTNQCEWIKAEDFKPEDDRILLISWWDYEKLAYQQPIRAYWDDDKERFFSIDTGFTIAVEVDIWCYFPELPEEKL
jgi:hypothetical protein